MLRGTGAFALAGLILGLGGLTAFEWQRRLRNGLTGDDLGGIARDLVQAVAPAPRVRPVLARAFGISSHENLPPPSGPDPGEEPCEVDSEMLRPGLVATHRDGAGVDVVRLEP